MKIGHYAQQFFSAGGVQSYVRRVVDGQRQRGHDVMILERDGDPGSPAAFSSRQAGIVPVRDDADLLRRARDLDLDVLHFHTPVFAPDDVAAEYAGPALVRTMHGHHAYCPSGARYLARSRTPCPRRYTLAGCLWGHLGDHCGSVRPAQFLEGFRRVRQERSFLARCHTVAVSHFTRAQMMRSGYDADAISVVHNPAPAARPEADTAVPAAGPPRFVFLGRMVAGKGLRWLIEAAARVRGSACFEVIGSGPEKPRLVRLAQTLGVAGQIAWADWLIDEADVFARLASARALIFPSLWQEPAGLVTMEAAASGRAVVASRVGGIPEYAAELGNTLLVEPGDASALAAAIDRLSAEPVLAAQLGRTGWSRVRAGVLGLETHLDQLETVYQRVIAGSPQPLSHLDA